MSQIRHIAECHYAECRGARRKNGLEDDRERERESERERGREREREGM